MMYCACGRWTPALIVTGVSGSPARLLIAATILDGRRSSTRARLRISASWADHVFGKSSGQRRTIVPGAFVTSGTPFRSRISPRGASILIVLIWLFCAARRYSVPERTWSAQSRKKRTAKTATATTLRTARRTASLGVNRYGVSTRSSGGRNSAGRRRRGGTPVVLLKELHLADRLRYVPEVEHPAAEDEDRDRDQQVQQQSRRQRIEEDRAGRSALADHEPE